MPYLHFFGMFHRYFEIAKTKLRISVPMFSKMVNISTENSVTQTNQDTAIEDFFHCHFIQTPIIQAV